MKSAEVEVYRGVYYDASKNPIPNGLLDPRMVMHRLSFNYEK